MPELKEANNSIVELVYSGDATSRFGNGSLKPMEPFPLLMCNISFRS